MNRGAVVVDRAELIKWWDACDALANSVDKGLQMARECRHLDAQWLSSLFPPGTEVTQESVAEVLDEQVDDPRAMFLSWRVFPLCYDHLFDAAEQGYAQAQARLSAGTLGEDALMWAQASASEGDRAGLFELAECYWFARGCEADRSRAMELYEEAGNLGHAEAQHKRGEYGFAKHDWRRFLWLGRAAERGYRVNFVDTVVEPLPLFEQGKLGRVLHIVGPLVKRNLGVEWGYFRSDWIAEEDATQLARVIQLHDAMLDRARRAIACFGLVARRLGVAKDIRVLIGKMVWDEPWRWGEQKAGCAECDSEK
jgi:hypothetical protein